MVEAIRVIAQYLAAQVGKATVDARVLRAMAKVPRHEFVPVEVKPYAYLNRPLTIGFDKTISQPLIVAVMTDMLELQADDVVLEIGTGLGYRHTELDRSRLANRQCPSSVPPGSCRRQFFEKELCHWPMREIVNGIFYVMRAGCPWRLLPNDLPPWDDLPLVRRLARRWAF